jgi:hypothetical protein
MDGGLDMSTVALRHLIAGRVCSERDRRLTIDRYM